jgi:flagellar biosynthesis/type III secretory pathway M-ring protein FliF/YscJ
VNEVLLAVIALGVLVMAGVQVAVVIFAARAASRLDRLANRIEQEIRPVVANLQAVSADAARVASLAVVQVERADRVFADLVKRVDETLATLQRALLAPAREGLAVLNGLKAAFAVFRDLRRPSRRRAGPVEDEDALFIG